MHLFGVYATLVELFLHFVMIVSVTLRLQGPKRLFSRQEQKDQFKLEDTVLNHNEDRMELYKRGSQSAQVPYPHQQLPIQTQI